MPDQKFKQEFYLTEQGWISGNSWLHRDLEQPVIKRPIDAVETWIRTEKSAPGGVSPEVGATCVWTNQDFPPGAIRALHLKFPPGGLAGFEKTYLPALGNDSPRTPFLASGVDSIPLQPPPPPFG